MSTKSITPKDYNPKKFGRKNKVKEKITVGSDGMRAISPFTGEYDVVIEQDDKNGESRMCVKSGYNTSELYSYTENSPHIEKFEENTTQLIKDTKYKDEDLGQYWYLTTIIFQSGMLYPDGDVDNIRWVFSPVVKISKDEQEKYPVPGKDGEYYETRVAVELSESFNDFNSACKRMGAFGEQKNR